MHNTSLQIRLTLILALLVGAAGSSRGGTSIAVNFSGRGVNNDFGTGAFLATGETAGVVPQVHWNNVDVNGGNPDTGTTLGLFDSGYNFTTAVTTLLESNSSTTPATVGVMVVA